MPETTRMNYKKTLNLPKTSFPMRAGLTANEPRSLARWQQQRLYDRVLADREGADLGAVGGLGGPARRVTARIRALSSAMASSSS